MFYKKMNLLILSELFEVPLYVVSAVCSPSQLPPGAVCLPFFGKAGEGCLHKNKLKPLKSAGLHYNFQSLKVGIGAYLYAARTNHFVRR